MVKCPTKSLVAVFTVVVLMASSFIAPPVLCIGVDGHVAIEAKLAGVLSDCDFHLHGSHDEEPSASDPVDGKDHCGSCDDFAISQYSRPQSSDVSDLMDFDCCQPVAAVVANRINIFNGVGMIEPFISRAPPIKSTTLASLRTVIIIS